MTDWRTSLCSRRAFLGAAAAGIATAGWSRVAASPALSGAAFARPAKGADGHVLVSVFLRGGADGLNIVVPYGEDEYYRRRPGLAIAGPNRRNAGGRALDVDGFFGLHPALAALHPLVTAGQCAIVHAAGTGDQTRSHFEAMATMERGVASEGGPASGWLGRHLASQPGHGSPLRAVALGSMVPDSLRGGTSVSAFESIDQFRLETAAGDEGARDRFAKSLASLYGGDSDLLSTAGRETLAVLKRVEQLGSEERTPRNGAVYPGSGFGGALRQVAMLARADVGLEVAALDLGGWDTHFAQGGATGQQAALLKDLGDSLAAFARDMGDEMKRVTVVVMSEFGRRVYENGGLGTDHGRGSVMFLLGGNVKGGKVYGQWPTLAPEALEGPGDLRVTTDYRNVLGELLQKRMSNTRLDQVFPGHTYRPLDLIA